MLTCGFQCPVTPFEQLKVNIEKKTIDFILITVIFYLNFIAGLGITQKYSTYWYTRKASRKLSSLRFLAQFDWINF